MTKEYDFTFYNNQVKKHGMWWSGNYDTWENADKECLGYDQQLILDKIIYATEYTKDKPDKFERDGCIISGEPEPSFAALHWIKHTSQNNEINLIDFGGSLGSTYFQLKGYLTNYKIRWNVIEQEHFVTAGRKKFESDELKFYYSIEECLKDTNPKCFFSSSAYPYIKNAYQNIESMLKHNFDWIILDKITIVDQPEDRITIQAVPPDIYPTIYPCWFFSESKLLDLFTKGNYHLISMFEHSDAKWLSGFIPKSNEKGYIFKNNIL